MRKPVWLFSEGSLKRRDLLGNKGANLCEMTSLGMPVPFGFIITTQTHLKYQRLRPVSYTHLTLPTKLAV